MTETENISPALLDLMDHEKVIEQGLHTFIDVGHALAAIRDGKKYKALGYGNFEEYVSKRWDMSRERARQLMNAADIASVLPTKVGILAPASERQVRPLAPLAKRDPDAARDAWAEAAEQAGGQPTAADVQAAVNKRQPRKLEHPARFSDPILDTIATHVTGSEIVLDPFAGTGRVHELRERAGVTETIGIEIEPEWADKHPDTLLGDALDLGASGIDPESIDHIVTSPTYGNRMADHHDAKDDSVRNTYKHTLGRDLADNNSGQMQWGDQYREFHRRAWAEAVAVLKPGGHFTINIKNHIRNGEVQRVVEWHIETLMHEFGLHMHALDVVPTKGLASGANDSVRTTHEYVITFEKAA